MIASSHLDLSHLKLRFNCHRVSLLYTIANMCLKLLLQIIEEDIENYASVIKGLHDQVDELGDEDKTSPEVVDRCRK